MSLHDIYKIDIYNMELHNKIIKNVNNDQYMKNIFITNSQLEFSKIIFL